MTIQFKLGRVEVMQKTSPKAFTYPNVDVAWCMTAPLKKSGLKSLEQAKQSRTQVCMEPDNISATEE